MSNTTEKDIIEIKELLKSISKSVNILKKIMKDDYFNEVILDFYQREEEERDAKFERARQLDDLISLYEDQKRTWGRKNDNIQKYCERTLEKLYDEYMDLMIDLNNEDI